MKKLIMAALLVASVSAFAQNENNRTQRANMNPEQRVERMATQLGLSTEQQEKLKEIYAEAAKNRQNQSGFSREQMREERKKNDEKVKAILTPEQLKKWEDAQQKMRERMQQRMQDRPQGADMNN